MTFADKMMRDQQDCKCGDCSECEIRELRAELEECKDTILSVINQACGEYDREKGKFFYDSLCLSAYESGLDFALEKGWIDPDQVTN